MSDFLNKYNIELLWDVFIEIPLVRKMPQPRTQIWDMFIVHLQHYTHIPSVPIVKQNADFLDHVCSSVQRGTFFRTEERTELLPLKRDQVDELEQKAQLHVRELEQYTQQPTMPTVRFAEKIDSPIREIGDTMKEYELRREYDVPSFQPPKPQNNEEDVEKQSRLSLQNRMDQIEKSMSDIATKLDHWSRQVDELACKLCNPASTEQPIQ